MAQLRHGPGILHIPGMPMMNIGHVKKAAAGGGVPVLENSGSGEAVASSVTTSFTIASGSDKLLLVFVHWVDAVAGTATVSGITWNTTENLTQLSGAELIVDANAAYDMGIDIWYLINPTSGTFNVVTTMTEAISENLIQSFGSFQGAHQTTPLGAASNNTSETTTWTLDVSSASGEYPIASMLSINDGSASAAGSDTEIAGMTFKATATSYCWIAQTATGAATVTLNGTGLLGTVWDNVTAGVSVKPT